MARADSFLVDVAYALPDRQRIVRLRVQGGSTLEDAVRQSGILAEFPEIDLATAKLGIFGRRAQPHDKAAPGDRIEIYRLLLADPKLVRRRRAGQWPRV